MSEIGGNIDFRKELSSGIGELKKEINQTIAVEKEAQKVAEQTKRGIINYTKYRKSEADVMKEITKAYNSYSTALQKGNSTDKAAKDMMRWANAGEALGYELKNITDQMNSIISAQRELAKSVNLDKSGVSKYWEAISPEGFKKGFAEISALATSTAKQASDAFKQTHVSSDYTKQIDLLRDKLKYSHGDFDDLDNEIKKVGKDGNGAFEQLEEKINNLSSSVKPLNEIISRIGKNSSIKNIPFDNLAEEAGKACQEMIRLSSEGKEESEEYLTNIKKIFNIIESHINAAGGVKRSGASSLSELRSWIIKSLESDSNGLFNKDFFVNQMFNTDKYIDATTNKLRSLTELVGNTFGYKGTSFTDGFGLSEDKRQLEELNKLLIYIRENRDRLLLKSQESLVSSGDSFIAQQEIDNHNQLQEEIRETESAYKSLRKDMEIRYFNSQESHDEAFNSGNLENYKKELISVVEETNQFAVDAEISCSKGATAIKKIFEAIGDQIPIIQGWREFVEQAWKDGETKGNYPGEVNFGIEKLENGNWYVFINAIKDYNNYINEAIEKQKELNSRINDLSNKKDSIANTAYTVSEINEIDSQIVKKKEELLSIKKEIAQIVNQTSMYPLEDSNGTELFNYENAHNVSLEIDKQISLCNTLQQKLVDLHWGGEEVTEIVRQLNEISGIKLLNETPVSTGSQTEKIRENTEVVRENTQAKQENAKANETNLSSGEEIHAEQVAMDNAVDSEKSALNELATQVNVVKDAIRSKTDEIVKEENQMRESVGKEISALKHLEEELGEVKKDIGEIGNITINKTNNNSGSSGSSSSGKSSSSKTDAETQAIKEEYDQRMLLKKEEEKENKRLAKEIYDQMMANKKAESDENKRIAKEQEKLNSQREKQDREYWQGRFKDSIDDLTTNNPVLSEMRVYYSQLEKEANKAAEAQSKVTKEIEKTSNTTSKISNFDVLGQRLQNLKSSGQEVDDLIAKYNHLKSIMNEGGSSKQTEQWNIDVKKLNESVTQTEKSISEANEKSRVSTATSIQNFLTKNTAISNGAKLQLKEFLSLLKSESKLSEEELNRIKIGFDNIKQAEYAAGNVGLSFFDIMKKRFQSLAAYLGSFASFYKILDIGKKIFTSIKDLDTEVVDINKTFQGSKKELEQMYNNSAELAKQLGVSTKEVLAQEAAWSRAGFSVKATAEEMAKLSSMFASISPGMDIDTSQQGLVSIMKAYKIDVSDVQKEIMDTTNVVGNKFNTTNTDIVEGLQRSSAALAAGNNTLKESIAMFTAGQEIVNNAEVMGQSLKTISLRIRGFDEETEELSEDLQNISGDIADLTKTAQHPLGVSLFTDETKQTYKSTYQVLSDIHDIYNELTDKQQADLTKKLFGTTRAQAGNAIFSNWEAAERAIEEMENSFGSADAEMENIRQSIDFKLNALAETWTETWQRMIDRGDVGKVIDILTELSEALGFVIEHFWGLGVVVAGTTVLGKDKRNKDFVLCG